MRTEHDPACLLGEKFKRANVQPSPPDKCTYCTQARLARADEAAKWTGLLDDVTAAAGNARADTAEEIAQAIEKKHERECWVIRVSGRVERMDCGCREHAAIARGFKEEK